MIRLDAMALHSILVARGGALYGDKVAVIRDESPDQIGSIIVPDQAKRKPLRGRCVMIGLGILEDQKLKGKSSAWHGLQIGDFLTFSKYDGTVINIPMPDDPEFTVEVMHGFDVYFGFGLEKS